MGDIYATPESELAQNIQSERGGGNIEDAIAGNIDVRMPPRLFRSDDALKYCGVSHHLQDQAAMYTQLRSDNVIVADTAPAHMHSTLINEYMALKRSGIF